MLISIKVARLRRNNGALGDITNVMSSENFSFYDKDPQEDFTKLVHLAGIVVSESACTTNTLPPSEHRVGTTPVTFDGTTLTEENNETDISDFRKGVRALHDALLGIAANNYHGNKAIDIECQKENAMIQNWLAIALSEVSPSDHSEWYTITELQRENDELRALIRTYNAESKSRYPYQLD